MSKTVKFGVVGNPVEHTRSPEIHLLFAKQFADNISYDKIEIPLGEFESALGDLIDEDYLGLNVTIPFKVDAFRCSTKCSSAARQSRAVNTLKFEGSKILGENTDGTGFVKDVQGRLKLPIAGKSVLILGAGGAVRGLLPSLLDEKPKSVSVANRSANRAQELAEEFGIQSILYDETAAEQYDIIINATPTTLQNKAPLIPLSSFEGCQLAYDLVYAPCSTPFIDMAKRGGVKKVSDGLGMLVEQAADSYEFWLGHRPETSSVFKDLRNSLDKSCKK